eukprot:3170823-Pleurochrysis_carterae.AAC.2
MSENRCGGVPTCICACCSRRACERGARCRDSAKLTTPSGGELDADDARSVRVRGHGVGVEDARDRFEAGWYHPPRYWEG